jgi:PAS domain S-box-containing protein
VAKNCDITNKTKSKNIEEERDYQRKYFQALFQDSPEGIISLDAKHRVVDLNPAFEKMFGYSLEDLQGNDIDEYIIPQRFEKEGKKYTQRVLNGKTVKAEIIRKKKDGSEIFVSILGAPIMIGDTQVGNFVIFNDITERKQTENALQESEEKYRSLVENISAGIYRNTPGPKGKFIEANPAIVKMFGYKDKKEFFNINVSDLYQDPADREKINRKLMEEGFIRNEELKLKKKDGVSLWGSVTAIAVYDKKGEVTHYDGVIEDITIRKRSEEDAMYQKKYFQALFNDSPEAIVSLDDRHKVVDINPGFEELFGYDLESLKGKNIDDFILPKRFEDEGKTLTDRVMGGHVVRVEAIRKRKDGKELFVSIAGAPIFVEDNQVGVFGIYKDISYRVKAEAQLKESEVQYRSTIEAMSDAIHVIDKDMIIILANPAFTYWLDILDHDNDVVGHNLFEVFPFLGDRVLDEYRQVFKMGTTKITEETTKISGREFITETRKIPITEGNKVTRVVTVVRDITERKKAEQELERAYMEIERALEQERRFKLETAHFFFNPICIAKGYLELMVEPLPEIEKKKLKAAMDAINRIEKVVKNVTQKGEIHE